MSERKYTLGEAAVGLTVLGAVLPLITLVLIPVDLGLAWMRAQVWNWFFVSYFHVPKMSVWMMFVIMYFTHMFRKNSNRSLKDDLYKPYVVEVIMFGVLFGVHLWIIK